MQEFDLEKAKAGAPVCTRDGRKARIICWDRTDARYPIIALVDGNGHEEIEEYTKDGKYCDKICNTALDLMMAEQKITKWTNIYDMHGTYTNGQLYNTEEDAKDCIDLRKEYVATIKVEWEV